MVEDVKVMNKKEIMIEEEKKLIYQCLNGDKKAWDKFVEKYTKLIYNAIYRTLELKGYEIEPDLIEDLHQEVFLSLLKDDFAKIRKFEWKNNCSIATWIGVIARNLVLDFIRKESKSKGITKSIEMTGNSEEEMVVLDNIGDERYSPDKMLSKKETIKILSKSMDKLSSSDKILLELLYYDGVSYEEIAKILGKSVDAIYMQKKRVIDKLKGIVEKRC